MVFLQVHSCFGLAMNAHTHKKITSFVMNILLLRAILIVHSSALKQHILKAELLLLGSCLSLVWDCCSPVEVNFICRSASSDIRVTKFLSCFLVEILLSRSLFHFMGPWIRMGHIPTQRDIATKRHAAFYPSLIIKLMETSRHNRAVRLTEMNQLYGRYLAAIISTSQKS